MHILLKMNLQKNNILLHAYIIKNESSKKNILLHAILLKMIFKKTTFIACIYY